jgi:hypothetical protein
MRIYFTKLKLPLRLVFLPVLAADDSVETDDVPDQTFKSADNVLNVAFDV